MEIHNSDALLSIVRRDVENVATIADPILIESYGLADGYASGAVHRGEIVSTLCARMPTLAGTVAVMLAKAEIDEAIAYVRGALEALRATDEPLFAGAPTKEAFVRLLRKMMTPATARAHAGRTGVEEARQEAYVLVQKFAADAIPRKNVREVDQRNGTIGLPLMQARAALADTHQVMTDPTIRQRVERWAASAADAPEVEAVETVIAPTTDSLEQK